MKQCPRCFTMIADCDTICYVCGYSFVKKSENPERLRYVRPRNRIWRRRDR